VARHGHAALAAAAAQAGSADEYFVFFTTPQGHTVDAIAERMIPTDALGPGAREAGAVFYIDRVLAARPMLQTFGAVSSKWYLLFSPLVFALAWLVILAFALTK